MFLSASLSNLSADFPYKIGDDLKNVAITFGFKIICKNTLKNKDIGISTSLVESFVSISMSNFFQD